MSFNKISRNPPVIWQNEPYPAGEQLDAREAGVVRDVNGRVAALDPPDELRDDHEAHDDEERGDVEEEQPLEEAEVGRDARPKLALDRLQRSPPQFRRVEQLRRPPLDVFPFLRNTRCHSFTNNLSRVPVEGNHQCVWFVWNIE